MVEKLLIKPGFLGSLGSIFKNFFVFLVTFWKYSIFIIILIALFYSGLKESIQTHDFSPLAKDIGLRMLSADVQLYTETHRIIKDRGILVKTTEGEGLGKIKIYFSNLWETIKAVLSLFASIYLIGFMVWIFYGTSVFLGISGDNILGRLLVAILFVSLCSIIGGLLVLNEKTMNEKVDYTTKLVPIRGVIELVKASPYIIESTYYRILFLVPNKFDVPTVPELNIEGNTGGI